MHTNRWCPECEFETVHADGKCTICALSKLSKEDMDCLKQLEAIRLVHPEVSEELGDETGG